MFSCDIRVVYIRPNIHCILAQNFADKWRCKLFMESFDHPDPIHNAPTDEEMAWIPIATSTCSWGFLSWEWISGPGDVPHRCFWGFRPGFFILYCFQYFKRWGWYSSSALLQGQMKHDGYFSLIIHQHKADILVIKRRSQANNQTSP